MNKVYYNYYNLKPQRLLKYLNDDISDDDVEKILSLQDLNESVKDVYSHYIALKGISNRSETIMKKVFNKYIECDNPYFKFRDIDKYLKYTNIVEYNYFMIKIYDKLDLLDNYIKEVEFFNSERNAGLLVFYYIYKKSEEETLNLIDKIIKSNIFYTIKRNRKNRVKFELLNHVLSINNMFSYNGFSTKLFNILNNKLFDTFNSSEKAKLLKKLSGYYRFEEYKKLYDKLSSNITPNQFLDLKPIFEKDDIEKYSELIKDNININNLIIKGLSKTNSITLVNYIKIFCENGLINTQNSTVLMKQFLTYEEFLSYGKIYKKNIYDMYYILMKSNPDLNELNNYFTQRIRYIWIESIYKKRKSFWIGENKKQDMIKNGLDELKFMKRRDLINNIKNKMKKDEQC